MKVRYLEGKKACLLLFLLCFTMYSLVYMSKNLFSSAMASIVEAGVMTKGQTGAISAAYWIAYTPFQVVGGFAADRFSPSKLIAIGLGGAALSNLIISLNQSYPLVMAVWIFNAIIQFGLWPSTFKIISTQIHPKYRTRAIFWILFGTSAGLGASMLMASLVNHWVDNFRLSFLILAITLLVWLIAYPRLSRRMVDAEDPESHLPFEKRHEEHLIPPRFGKLFLASGLVILIFISFFRNMLDNAVKMVTPTMLMETYDSIPAAIANRLSLLLVLFSAVGIILGGQIQKRITDDESRATTLMLALAVPFMAVTCFVGSLPYPLILISLSVGVMLLHGAAPFSGSFAARRFVPYGKSGTVSGILNAAAGFGNVFASFAFAKMAETLPWSAITLTWVICLAVTILLSLGVTRTWTRFIRLHKSK